MFTSYWLVFTSQQEPVASYGEPFIYTAFVNMSAAQVNPYAAHQNKSATRLYQMGIAAFWNEINELFYIDSYIDGHWESFRTKRNYEAFLLERK